MAMLNLAGYGYIIAGVDLFWPVMDEASKLYGIRDLPGTVFEVIQWVGLTRDDILLADYTKLHGMNTANVIHSTIYKL